MREVAIDEFANVLVTTRADSMRLVGEERAELAPVWQVTGTALAFDDRSMRARRNGRNIGVVTTTTERHLAFRQ